MGAQLGLPTPTSETIIQDHLTLGKTSGPEHRRFFDLIISRTLFFPPLQLHGLALD